MIYQNLLNLLINKEGLYNSINEDDLKKFVEDNNSSLDDIIFALDENTIEIAKDLDKTPNSLLNIDVKIKKLKDKIEKNPSRSKIYQDSLNKLQQTEKIERANLVQKQQFIQSYMKNNINSQNVQFESTKDWTITWMEEYKFWKSLIEEINKDNGRV